MLSTESENFEGDIIMNKKLTIVFISLLLLIQGCSTTKVDFEQFTEAAGNGKYPPLSVVMTSDDLQYAPLAAAFMSGLRDSQLFLDVDRNNPYRDLVMETYVDVSADLGMAEAVAEGFVMGFTLGLIPVKDEFTGEARIVLRYQGAVVDEFAFEFTYDSETSMRKIGDRDSGASGVFRYAAQKALEHIESRGTLREFVTGLESEHTEQGIII